MIGNDRTPAVEKFNGLLRIFPLSHLVENGLELSVFLPEYFGELNGGEVDSAQRFCAEEEEICVACIQQALEFVVSVRCNGGQLKHIADEQNLNSAERDAVPVGSVFLQIPVDAVEKVGAEHGNFVDDQQIQFVEQIEA